MPRTHPPYPPEFKLEAVRLVKEGEPEYSRCSPRLGREWTIASQLDPAA